MTSSTLAGVIAQAVTPYLADADPPPVVRDLVALAEGDRRAGALDGRYGPALADLTSALADGTLDPTDPGAPAVALATLAAQRERWIAAASRRNGAATSERTVTLPPRYPTARVRWNGAPEWARGSREPSARPRGGGSPDIGEPTYGSAGPAPDQYGIRRAHDRIAAAIDRERRAHARRAARAPRRIGRDVTGYRGPRTGTYHATPGDPGRARARHRKRKARRRR